MPDSKSHRDLIVWQHAMDLVFAVYAVLPILPNAERYALTDQVRRAAISVPANIAEGQARSHTKEFIHFLCIARGSLAELDTLLELAHRLSYIPADEFQRLNTAMLNTVRLLNALISAIRAKTPR
jgi:four helix bundle protein